MKIAVLSGKGGTGKTMISVNLAAAAKESIYLDCDVEEPNGHLYFRPEDLQYRNVSIKMPVINENLCNGCRVCVDFCKYNALAYINDRVLVFEDVCHSCGGCSLLCPEKAVSEKEKVIGQVVEGRSENVTVISGVLNTGEASGIPIIKNLLARTREEKKPTLVDCPPGSACIVMESIKDADYCLLVTEPTMFGLHNFQMVFELVKLFNKPCGVIINKCMQGENPIEDFCNKRNINILLKIPFNQELAKMNSNGLIAAREKEKYLNIFKNLLQTIMK